MKVEKSKSERKWETARGFLEEKDIIEDWIIALGKAASARTWIARQGYHLREDSGYAAIRLEKNSYTIIDVVYQGWQFVAHREYTSECVIYAAMLLYQRLKRDKVLA